MNLLHVVGARPNFMKAGPVHAACARAGLSQMLVHTGQHYDFNMSDIFFTELGLPAPDLNLGVGSGGHTEQTAGIMLGLAEAFERERPEMVVVYGDVNSTVAAALVCAKAGIPLAHVEAGLRSGDRRMPEEINRLVTDQLADLLFTPSEDGDANLLREGVAAEKIHFVGNVMIDTLVKFLPKLGDLPEGKYPKEYALVTLHRPSNVDAEDSLRAIMESLGRIGRKLPVIFPVHPRTRQRLEKMGIGAGSETLQLIEPLGYFDFMNLVRHARAVVTDSGGIQEETTFLGIPCFTLRENTERPITISIGTNVLIGFDYERLERQIGQLLEGDKREGKIPPLWDGKTGERIAAILKARLAR